MTDRGPADPNPYRRRFEDIDPARHDPSTSIEHVEPVRERASPWTIEGALQGFSDLSAAAVSEVEPRRTKARLFVFFVLLAILTPVALQLLGLLSLF